MKILLVSVLLLLTNTTIASESTHWGYEKNNGPKHWSEIRSTYSLCRTGKNQSPINITGFIKVTHKNLNTRYQSKVSDIVNNGHTIQVNMKTGSKIKIEQTYFELKQFHFHSPSENTISGKSYPLEGHFVHADNDGNLAVLSVMFDTGDKNAILEALWNHMPEKIGDHNKLTDDITASNLLPNNRDYYRFNGSLTTPPCSEGVRWYVLKNSVTISKQQVEKFKHTLHHANNRPVQSLNARIIIE